MRVSVAPSGGEEAAFLVANAVLHSRGLTKRKRDAIRLLDEVYDELVRKRVFEVRARAEYMCAELRPKQGEAIDAAVFRHVLRQTGDPNLAEHTASLYAHGPGGLRE